MNLTLIKLLKIKLPETIFVENFLGYEAEKTRVGRVREQFGF